MRFRVAAALGGGLSTWRKLGEIPWSEFVELWGYARYQDKCEEAKLVNAVLLPWAEKNERGKTLRKLQQDLKAVESERELEEREKAQGKTERLNDRINKGT
jgi:hypothetical protein